ncbi:hypothetical protein BOTNAR_0105g00010 [Botryotinia narcissicola]|uniref:Uncharacterized protein n=1 Tax=Botryotinia narcissicola TaxID=278944 RepID=A0A4Z1IU30_9HELO|nr:hypothetical protein BOTNAR_0105g00010 [Botryotinia narcissicola]
MALGGVWEKQLKIDSLDPKMSQICSVPVLRFAPQKSDMTRMWPPA